MYKEITSFGVDEEKENSSIIVILKQLSLNDFITEIRNSDLEIKNLSDEAVEALYWFFEEIKNVFNLNFLFDLKYLNLKVREFKSYEEIKEKCNLSFEDLYNYSFVIELENGNILSIKKFRI